MLAALKGIRSENVAPITTPIRFEGGRRLQTKKKRPQGGWER